MQWEADLIHGLQASGNSALNILMNAITYLGDEIFFMGVAVILFWCYNKRSAFRLINVYLLGAAVIEVSKIMIGRLRPFQKYADGGYVESLTPKPSDSYSFPSGHSHSIANLSTQLTVEFRRKIFIVLPVCFAVTLLVMFSRIYLGQHYLTDTLAGMGIGIAVALLGRLLFDLLKNKEEYIAIVAIPLCLTALIIFLVNQTDPLLSGKIVMIASIYLAVTSGYFIEKRFVNFDTRTGLIKNLIKIVIGGGVTAGLYFGLGAFLKDVIVFHYFVRYFLVGIWAILGAPALFKTLGLYGTDNRSEAII